MTTTLNIQNLKCSGCANTILTKLSNLDKVSGVTVDVENNSVTFDYQDDFALHEVKETLKSNGYPEEGENNPLVTKAKSFVSCAIGKMN
jgi:copper chaperone CopZ